MPVKVATLARPSISTDAYIALERLVKPFTMSPPTSSAWDQSLWVKRPSLDPCEAQAMTTEKRIGPTDLQSRRRESGAEGSVTLHASIAEGCGALMVSAVVAERHRYSRWRIGNDR